MNKLLKNILLLFVVSSFALTGCDDMFDKGDVEKAYDGPDVVGFKPLQATATEGGSDVTIEVQLISSEGLASSDITVNLSVDGESSATAANYTLNSNSVTIASGTASGEFTVSFPADSGLDDGDEVILLINISGGDVPAGENIDQTTIFINGVDESAV